MHLSHLKKSLDAPAAAVDERNQRRAKCGARLIADQEQLALRSLHAHEAHGSMLRAGAQAHQAVEGDPGRAVLLGERELFDHRKARLLAQPQEVGAAGCLQLAKERVIFSVVTIPDVELDRLAAPRARRRARSVWRCAWWRRPASPPEG